MSNAAFHWDGEAMVPVPVHRKRCDELFVIGETYHLEEVKQRSMRSHRHYFASVAEAWKNLPESFGMEPWAQSADHLRAYALIKTGYCDTQTFACSSKAEAARWAGNMRPMDEYSVVVARGDTVYRFTAQSQSTKAMGAENFAASKTAVLDFVSNLIGTTSKELQRNAA
ncbi:hypothetical protein [Halocynthiibacter styelae]|uniref:Uncharacterized protein n=1 Tax=Halocynthiibacter styelae TaxID=2761955 RepID=A0A8J7IED5_9RHOB|nr:hypothetical protein [Paenihalocynthiibacter styelae]MBI1493437.1 hypothetical protein [Paenihalocynthiibacter styelae]